MGLKRIRTRQAVKKDYKVIVKKLLVLLLKNNIITKEESDSISGKGE